jgi:Zn-dependent protease
VKILLLLFTSLKLGKILVSAGSMVLTIGVYAMIFGLPFAAGFVVLLLIHEMGHYAAARQRGLDVGLPAFIPFVGAWINLREQPHNAETEAYVAYAGPFVGTLGAFAAYFWGRHIESDMWMALAYSGFMLNLFNLIPLSPLDGGRITQVLSPRIWLIGLPMLVALFFYSPSPLLIIIGLLALPNLLAAWRYDPNAPGARAYRDVPLAVRVEYAILYLGLAGVLAIMAHEVHGGLAHAAG